MSVDKVEPKVIPAKRANPKERKLKMKLTQYERTIKFIEKAQSILELHHLADELEDIRCKLGDEMRARIDELAPRATK